MSLSIKNKQVQEIYDRWNAIWHNTQIDEDIRLEAFTVLQTINALVVNYEHNSSLEEEDVQHLFIDWKHSMKPIFPEKREELNLRLKNKK